MSTPVLFVSEGPPGEWWHGTVLTRADVEVARRQDYDSAYASLLTGFWRLFVVEPGPDEEELSRFLWRVRVSPWTVPPRGLLVTSSQNPSLRLPPVARVVRHPPSPREVDEALSPLLDLPVRECCRVPLRLAVRGTGALGKSVSATTVDLSSGGMLVQSERPLAMGERLAWSFPGARPLEGIAVRGAVLRQREQGDRPPRRTFPIRFDATARREREAIERFLQGLGAGRPGL